MIDLTKITTEELEAEIQRRQQCHSILIRNVEFTLSLEEVKELQEKLNKINPPLDHAKEFKDTLRKIHEDKTRNPIPWVQPPINVPNWPGYPQGPNDYPQPPKIWCGSATS